MRVNYKNIRDMGQYDYETKQIIVRKGLKERYEPSKLFVIAHEEYHKYLDDKNIELGGIGEEILCDVWAIVSLKKKQLSYGDIILRRDLKRKYKVISKAKLYKIREEIWESLK